MLPSQAKKLAMDCKFLRGRYADWQRITYQPAIEQHLPGELRAFLPAGARVLDIGCNQGSNCLSLAEAGFLVSGIDINAEAIRQAQERAEHRGLTPAANIKVADAVEEPLDSYDAVMLIRTLTCIPDQGDWLQLVRQAWGAVVPAGLLYVHDFLKVADSEVYRTRYLDGVARGWREGNFQVTDPQGAPLFVAHHHDEPDVSRIQAQGETLVYREHSSLSMNGNPCRMFVYLGRKPRKSDPGCEAR